MNTPIRTRLTLGYLLVLLTGMGLAAILAWATVEELYLNTQRENLLAQAQLTADSLQGQPLPALSEPYLQTANTLPGIHTRIIGENGGVIVSLPLPAEDTPVQAPLAENSGFTLPSDLLERSEIDSALKGDAATAIRRVPSAGNRRVLYAAAPILDVDGKPTGIIYLAMPLAAAGLPATVMFQLGGALIVAIVLASFAGGVLARRIAHPIEQVARAAKAVSEGDLNQKVAIENNIVELNSLSNSFNDMTASLKKSDEARNAFIADVTHELRTPLTVIKGTIETLEDGALDDTAGRGALLSAMQRETDRLIRLVNDLLVLTRADAGALKLDPKPLDLGELAQARCGQLAGLAAQKGVVLTMDGCEAPPRGGRLIIHADADRISQVLDNLFDNAIRYSPAGGKVIVSICQNGDEISCSVKDGGPGIPEKHLPFIFERFYRADASRNRNTGGAGLGLAIARALVLAHGGTIEAKSIEGQGTTITFSLPL